MDVFLARQPVFDRERRVYGYELLYRSSTNNVFDGTDATSATTQLLANSLLTFGLDRLVGEARAFVNFGRELLLSEFASVLPKDRTVIELLETVEPDEAVVKACQELRRQGYLLALDDFVVDGSQDCLLAHANIVKLEMSSLTPLRHTEVVRRYHARGLMLLAEKVETYEEFQQARASGYDYFQGYFFAKPTVLESRQLPAATVHCISLLRELGKPELDLAALADLISADVALSYKLLRYVNSALFHRSRRIDSLRQALALPGETELRKWIAMAAIPKMAVNKPGELLTASLVRASMCESLARHAKLARPEQAFLMGIFSFLDALMDRPLDQALAEVHLATAPLDALLGTAPRNDPFSAVLAVIRAYDTGQWDEIAKPAELLRIDAATIRDAYSQAVAWAAQVQP
jgi:EAL and modified HD-GYP domain-containing signal transduction protein